MNLHELTQHIQTANAKGRVAVIPFLTASFPDPEAFWKNLGELDAGGADIIEIGVPFSDPVADGPVVEAASQKALEYGITIDWILDGLLRRKGQYASGLVLMGYYNPFLQYGLEIFAARAHEAGVSGIIVPDLPLEESDGILDALKKQDLALIPLVGLNTTLERMQQYARSARGYAYLVSVLGTTGMRGGFSPELNAALARAKEAFSIPVALGFGISRPEQLQTLPIKPEAVVFGSSLLCHLAEGRSAADFMKHWHQ